MLGRGYDEFIQEYGTRFQWDIPLMHKYIDWNNLFMISKLIGIQRQLGIGERKRLSNLYLTCPM